ncbi:hypothetical protein [Pseudonocardia phyllosphaerae]|uniref:hypothetical protein n=1 Tax=Pseudonocardia phyllosphaerae TaxID=3390502 RepID=UPI003979772C
MMEPVGPLSASTYWRRRVAAIGAAVLVLVVLVALGSALLPGSSDEPTDPVARAGQAPNAPAPDAPAPKAPAPNAPGRPGAAPAAPNAPAPAPNPLPGTAPGAPPGVAVAPPAGPATPNAGPADGNRSADERVRPDDTPRPSVAVPAGEPSPPTGPVPCTDRMLDVRAETGRPSYPAGGHPELRLVVTNVSGQACVRDLDGAEQEIVVRSGGGDRRLWSSNDCVNPASEDLRTLVPGQPAAFTVTWSGRTSQPGCAAARQRVPAGAYRVTARLGQLSSDPVPLLLG